MSPGTKLFLRTHGTWITDLKTVIGLCHSPGWFAFIAQLLKDDADILFEDDHVSGELMHIHVSCGVRTHAQSPAVDLKSTPLTTWAN